MNSKAQADIVSAALIVIISLGFIAVAYTWGIPLIQKRQDTAIVDRVASHFDQNNKNSLPSIIEFIANNQGEQTFSSPVDGLWLLDDIDDSITFVFFSKITKVAADTGWVSLSGDTCPPSKGYVGKDKASVVCARADRIADGYNITYKVWFRELEEVTGLKTYKIDLLRHEAGSLAGTGHSVRVFFVARESDGNLIRTKIKILLV